MSAASPTPPRTTIVIFDRLDEYLGRALRARSHCVTADDRDENFGGWISIAAQIRSWTPTRSPSRSRQPTSRRGCLILTYGHGEQKQRAVEGVQSLKSELRKILLAEANELIGLSGTPGRAKIEIEVASELPKFPARGKSTRR